MAGNQGSSTKTDWSMIQEASGNGAEAATALEHIARRYWPPVYAYIRSTGRDVHEASDLTQDFICDVIMGRQLLARANPERGRFRHLLLTALRNYLRQEHRSRHRRKSHTIAIDPHRLDATDALIAQRTPEQAFCTQWSAMLVGRVLEQVRENCLEAGLEAHWTIFEQRVARPLLLNERPAEYASLLERLQLNDTSQAANMMITVKRRFAKALIAEVRKTVEDPLEAEAELADLLNGLEGAAKPSVWDPAEESS